MDNLEKEIQELEQANYTATPARFERVKIRLLFEIARKLDHLADLIKTIYADEQKDKFKRRR